MSRFLDRLERIWAGEAQPLGFAIRAALAQSPAMAIVVRASQGQLEVEAPGLEGVDAVLLSVPDPNREADDLSRFVPALADIPWGASLAAATGEGVERLKGLGCDFLTFSPDEMPVVILDQDMGKVLEVDTSLSDNLARSIARLPIDAVLLSSERWPLTVRLLLDYGRLASLSGRPCLAQLPAAATAGDIEALWEAGICGVVTSERQRLPQIKEAVQALPKTKRKPKRKRGVTLPLVSEASAEASEEEEEEI